MANSNRALVAQEAKHWTELASTDLEWIKTWSDLRKMLGRRDKRIDHCENAAMWAYHVGYLKGFSAGVRSEKMNRG